MIYSPLTSDLESRANLKNIDLVMIFPCSDVYDWWKTASVFTLYNFCLKLSPLIQMPSKYIFNLVNKII